MSVPFSNTKLRVPRGFQSLLEGLAREVLRSQPADIYTFGAMYFEELVRRREETGDDDPAQLAANVEDRFYNNTAFQQPTIDPSDPQQQDASKVIQTNFRRHAAQKEAAKLREDKAASEIQSAVRGHQEREAIKQSPPDQGSTEEVDIDLNDPEVEAAAARIQAGFKGYKTRKDLLEKKTAPSADADKEDSKIIDGPSNDDLEEAAVRIQAGYKGYRTRKEIKAKRESHEEASPGVDEAAAAEKPQDEEPQEQPAGEAQQDGNPEEEIDLNDPELAQAAIKIQAGFKGYQTRKKLKDEADQPEEKQDEAKEHKDAEEEQQPADAEEEKADEAKPEAAEADADAEAVDPNDPAQNQAASKIQAGFRGMQARKEVAEMRKTHQQEDDSAEANDEEAANEGEAAPEPEADDKAEAEAEAEPEAEAATEAEAEAEPEAEGKAEAEAEAEPEAEDKAEAEAEDKAEAEAKPEAEATPEAEAKPEAEAEGEPEAEPEADPEAPPAESAAAAAPGGEEENEAAAPAAADDAAGAEGDEPRDE